MLKNILVTGGAGYIGSHTVVELFSANYRPVIVDNFSTSKPRAIRGISQILVGKNDGGYDFVECDIRDTNQIIKIIREFSIEGVIHFAAYKSVAESVINPMKYLDNNILGMTSLLSAMRETKVRKLVLSSSCTVYGNPNHLPITEEALLAPINPYGFTKLICEQVLKQNTNLDFGLNAVSLRYFNPIGAHASHLIGDDPKVRSTNVLPLLIAAARGEESEFKIFGSNYPTPDGTAIRDYIHVVDLAKSHISALDLLFDKSKAINPLVTLNIGLGKGVSVLELVRTFESATGTNINKSIFERRIGDAGCVFCDNTLARQVMTDWVPRLSLKEACLDAYRFAEKVASEL